MADDDTVPAELADTAMDETMVDLGVAHAAPAGGAIEGRYESRGVLGAGGMGEVRLCHDKLVGRTVALKVIRAEHTEHASIKRRFDRECRVQAQLEHPAIVPVYDIGTDASGQGYFTMKRIRGLTLEQVLSGIQRGEGDLRETYTTRKLLTAFSSVCLAVAFAHSRGVVHRDLKPANIMLGEFGEVTVLDWGIAKLLRETEGATDDDVSKGIGQTKAGAIMGTPGYMAPEQARGDAVDARADIYSLGAILFELLSGLPLHDGATVEALIVSTLAGARVNFDERAPQAGAPSELRSVCERATASDPDARMTDAREIARAIDRFLEGDLDLERRRTQASAHFVAGVGLTTRARDDVQSRAAALNEFGRALALDPGHRAALAALIELLVTAPAELPGEAGAELEAAGQDRRRAVNRDVVRVMALLAFVLAAVLGLGITVGGVVVHDPIRLGLLIVAWVVIGVTNWIGMRLGAVSERLTVFGVALSFLMIAPTAWLFGPLVLVPSVVVAVTLSVSSMYPRAPRIRRAGLVLGLATIAIPVALDALRLVPPSYSFDGDTMSVLSQVVSFPERTTIPFLTLTGVLAVWLSWWLSEGSLKAQQAAEQRLATQLWYLRHLVPREAHGAASVHPPAL